MAKFYIAVMMGLLIFSSAARAGSGGLNILLCRGRRRKPKFMPKPGKK